MRQVTEHKICYSLALSKKDIERIEALAIEHEIPPRILARSLLLKALRAEIESKEA